jgi:K+-sensing histidine kinase KdpD
MKHTPSKESMKHNLNAYRWCPNKGQGYLNACVGVFFAFCIRLSLQPHIEEALPLFFFQINTIVIAFFFGVGPALLTLALSIPLISYFFMAPYMSFNVIDSRDITTLIVYMTYTLLVSFLVEWLRREQYNAKMAILVSESRFKLMVEGDTKIRELLKNSPPHKPE